MGLFDKMKKSKEFRKTAEWKQGLIHTHVELEEDHMKLLTETSMDIIFYKDIMSVQQVSHVVNIRTNVKTYSLTARKIRGGTDKAIELTQQILEMMNKNK